MKRFGFLCLATVGLLWGCAKSPQDFGSVPVTETQAQAFLEKAIEVTLQGKLDELCTLASFHSQCDNDLRQWAQSRPKQPPTILCSYELPPQKTDTAATSGGQVLVVTGRNGVGESYMTEVLVFREGEQLRGTNIVWWSNGKIGQTKLHDQSGDGRGETPVAERTDKCSER